MSKILIVEDETLINDLIRENLVLVGHECRQIYDGQEAKRCLSEEDFDLVLLDIMLPGCSGYDVLKASGDTPVIMLTAMGAEDYIVKPFDMLELIARVNAVLRRNNRQERELFVLGEIQVDLQSHTVKNREGEISLTLKEYELLEYFIHNRNIALSRERLIERVWGYDYEGESRTVDVHVASLRKKLGIEKELKTVYKLGYRLEVD